MLATIVGRMPMANAIFAARQRSHLAKKRNRKIVGQVNRIRLLTAIGDGLLYVRTNCGAVGLREFHCFEF
jgi:hypothetical protein